MSEFDEFNSNQKLSNDPISLVLGIGSILFTVLGCCCGFFTIIPGLLMGIVGWFQASNDLKAYNANPNYYRFASYNNTKTAKVLSIIGTIISGFLLILSILWFVGIVAQPGVLEELRATIQEIQQGN